MHAPLAQPQSEKRTFQIHKSFKLKKYVCVSGLPSQKTCSARINPIPALLIKRKPNVTYPGWRGTGSEGNSLIPIKLAQYLMHARETKVTA